MSEPLALTLNQIRIEETCDKIKNLLIEKNRSYGDSALSPVRVFSKASAEEQLLVRLDDKISRLARGTEFPGDDTLMDLAGYVVLLLVARGTPS